jgi:hypothetical protein
LQKTIGLPTLNPARTPFSTAFNSASDSDSGRIDYIFANSLGVLKGMRFSCEIYTIKAILPAGPLMVFLNLLFIVGDI